MTPTRAVLIVGILLVPAGNWAQEIPRGEYLHYVPLGHPRLLQQTNASKSLQLYGNLDDPEYRDVDPADGIDDRRHDILVDLAVRFAPYLVQNTTNLPVNFNLFIDNVESFPLFIDTWVTKGEESHLERKAGINFSVLGVSECQTSQPDHTHALRSEPTMDAAMEDCKLKQLFSRFSPLASASATLGQSFVRPRPDRNTVLFFDFPGEGPGSWEKAYEPEFERTPEGKRSAFPHSYVHPFVWDVRDVHGTLIGYDLVLQYWFYYPSNDGGNNHEGDWEHLNVVIAPKSRVEQALSEEEIGRILAGSYSSTDETTTDPLVIRRVEYYFHHFVMTLDFSSPNVYLPRDEWKSRVKQRVKERLRENELWDAIRHLAYVDDEETVINTHPFGYIGADNKGFDQALSAPGGKNRNSHGTFPFPGRYHNIGPAGATEQISLHVDHRRHLARLRDHEETSLPVFKRGEVIALADPQRLTVVPDWERVVALVEADVQARRNWSWLILPIRWGYPATESPLAGLLPHADTGNLAPHGPSFSSGWNVSGATTGFHAYEPHALPSVFPLRPQDGFRNELGFFNLTFPLLFNLPPLDFLTRLGTYPFKVAFQHGDPVYYPKEKLPYRFVGLSSGVSIQTLDKNFQAMAFNPQQFDEFLGRLITHLVDSGFDSTTTTLSAETFRDNSVGPFFQIPFYIGDRFASENTVRNVRSTFGLRADFSNIPSYSYSADLNYWEYAGSLRYSITPWRLQPFVKGGYGWSWYRVQNVQANGVPFQPAESQWIKPKNIWPTVWHFGAGLEFLPWKRFGTFPRGTEVSFRFEYGRYYESLGLDLSGLPLSRLSIAFPTLGDVPSAERLVRNDFLFGITVSF